MKTFYRCNWLLTLHPHPSSPPQAAHTPVAPVGSPVGSSLSLIPEDGLPPILISTGVKGGTGGHITGACLHPHHSAASSLLRQLLCLCCVFVFHMLCIMARVWTTHCKQRGRRGFVFRTAAQMFKDLVESIAAHMLNLYYPHLPSDSRPWHLHSLLILLSVYLTVPQLLPPPSFLFSLFCCSTLTCL